MRDLGEKRFIEELLPTLANDRRLIYGRGQDAAALALNRATDRIAFKIDRAARPVSVSENWSDHKAWGRLAVTANCSDLLASGATPIAFMVAVLVPGDWPTRQVHEMITGCAEECARHGITFAGGDTKESATPHLVGTAVGVYQSGDRVLPRNTAEAGQSLVMCGPVGGFLGAYLLLRRNPDSPVSIQWKDYLARPKARWQEAEFCRRRLTLSAGTDASDGLFDCLVELTKVGVGLEIDMDKIPYHDFAIEAAKECGIPIENFMFGAGDWNIFYACDEQRVGEHPASHVMASIGRFVTEPGIRAHRGTHHYLVNGPRNEHFRKRLEDGASWVDNVVNTRWLTPLTGTCTDSGAKHGV